MKKKRFIAGAECPECKQLDTLYVLAGELNGAFECASCGHRQESPQVETARTQHTNGEIQKVKFVDAGSSH